MIDWETKGYVDGVLVYEVLYDKDEESYYTVVYDKYYSPEIEYRHTWEHNMIHQAQEACERHDYKNYPHNVETGYFNRDAVNLLTEQERQEYYRLLDKAQNLYEGMEHWMSRHLDSAFRDKEVNNANN